MSVDVDVIVSADEWMSLENLEALARDCIRASLAASGAALAEPCEVAVSFCGDAEIRNLNAQWRGQNKPTNVLSFPTPGALPERPLLGDVVIAYETVAREAGEQAKTLRDHTAHMVIHGFLHLIGYDHETATEADAMEALERKIAFDLGLRDPYAPGEDDETGGLNNRHVDRN